MKRSNLLLIALVISFGHACASAQDEPANSDLAKAPEAATHQPRNLKPRALLRPEDANA